MKGHDVGATVAFADYTRDVDALRKQLADAQATVEALQAIIKQMGEQAAILAKDGMAAKAQVEALQRERGEAASDRDDWITSWRALQRYNERIEAALNTEREKVAERNEFIADCDMILDRIQAPRTNDGQEELVSTWRRIELIGVLLQQYRVQLEEHVRTQSQLSHLQALVRAWGTAHESVDDWFKRAATDENTPTISEFEAVKKVLFDSERALKATLDATTPARWTAEEIEQAKREAKELGKAIGWLDSTAKGGDGE